MRKKTFASFLVILLMTAILFSIMACKKEIIPGPNRAPIARAGSDIEVLVNERVMFNGEDSFDPDGDLLTYEWEILTRPRYAGADLQNRRGVKSCFLTPDKPGTWMIALTVCDGKKFSERDVVRLTVSDAEPVADIPDFEVTDIAVYGDTVNNTKYIREIRAKVKSNNTSWNQPLGFRVIGMDALIGGHFVFDETMTIQTICMRKGDEKWYKLVFDRLEWPEEVSQITFAAKVDTEDLVEETREDNNMAEITEQRVDLKESPTEVYYQAPDFTVSDFIAKGIYNDSFVNTVKAKIKNKRKKYKGPLAIKFVATSRSNVLVNKLIQIDNICLEQGESTWVDLSRREIEIPERLSSDVMPLAASINYRIDVDFTNLVEEMHEDNNKLSASPLVMDLLPYCSISVADEIDVGGPGGRMYTLKNNHFFQFDISSGRRFDFHIPLMNYCSPEDSVKIDLVFDWTPLRTDGDNIILKKDVQVDFPYTGQVQVTLDNIKIPSKEKFQRDFSKLAILAHHENGYDVLFLTHVEVRD